MLTATFSAPSNASEAVGLAVGLLEVVLAVFAARELRHHGRRFPWLVLLGVFFAARGCYRIYVAFSAAESESVLLGFDALAVAVLLLLILRLEDTISGLRRAEDAADWSRGEYERALGHYRSLVRHRLANPLTVLRGAAETLARREPELAPGERARLLGLLRTELDRLEATALEPVPVSEEERELDPEPRSQLDAS